MGHKDIFVKNMLVCDIEFDGWVILGDIDIYICQSKKVYRKDNIKKNPKWKDFVQMEKIYTNNFLSPFAKEYLAAFSLLNLRQFIFSSKHV